MNKNARTLVDKQVHIKQSLMAASNRRYKAKRAALSATHGIPAVLIPNTLVLFELMTEDELN